MSDMEKILEVGGMTRSSRLSLLEPTLRVLDTRSGMGLEKCASEAVDWAKSVKAKPGKTYILVLALGASEYYGPNRNGDAFEEKELKKTHKTFETDAHVFKSHVNKDPAKKLGDVVKSFYNEKMHRVELVLEIDNSKAPDVAKKIREQKDVAVSMGCRIKFDVCSICGNEASNRSKYCKHLKYEMGDIRPDGKVVCAYNPNPKFFDISIVWRPADRTGYMLKKVARLGPGLNVEYSGKTGAFLGEKTAALTVIAQALQKAADMEKKVEGLGTDIDKLDDPDAEQDLHSKWLKVIAPKSLKGYDKISSEDIKFLAGHELPKVLGTLNSLGIVLTTPEFLDLLFYRITGKPSPEGLAQAILDNQEVLFRKLSERPELVASVLETGAVAVPGACSPSPELAKKMAKYSPARSLSEEWITKRAYSGPLQASFTDPGTGAKYVTTPEELKRAKGVKRVNEGAALAGAAALSLITYKALNALIGVRGALGRVATILGAGLAGGGTYQGLVGDRTPRISREGHPIPGPALFRQVAPPRATPRAMGNHPVPVSGDESGMGSWVLPTMFLADRMLAGTPGSIKSASITLPSELDSDSIQFNLYSKKLGEALLKTTR